MGEDEHTDAGAGKAAGRQHKTLVVDNPTAVWDLAQMRTYTEAYKALLAALEEDVPATVHARRMQALAEHMNEKAHKAWGRFMRWAAANDHETQMIADIGLPDDVRSDAENDVVVLVWDDAADAREAAWGVFEVRADADNTGQTFQLTTPFREVQVDALPEGTQLIRINDPRHAATAALYEILEMILRDIDSFSKGLEPIQTWQRMRYQATFYQKVVRVSVKTLPDDEYRDWEPSLPERINIKEAPGIVATLAGTSRAQQILAMHIASRFYLHLIDLSEREGFTEDEDSGGEGLWVERVIEALRNARDTMKEALEGYNAAIMAFTDTKAHGRTAVAIMRPRPRSLPLLAVMPIATANGKRDAQTPLAG